MTDRWTDDELLRELGKALSESDPVPEHVQAAAVAAIELQNLDAELAALVRDTAADLMTGVRATTVDRSLTYRAGGFEIEVMLGSDGRLEGQIVPHQAGDVELHPASGESVTTRADDLGRFSFPSVPAGPVSFRCRLDAGGARFGTEWVVLRPAR